jgi:hypothetical protein
MGCASTIPELSAGDELVGVELGKLADSHRTASGKLLDMVVGARHVPVLIVKHRTAEMLNGVSWQ